MLDDFLASPRSELLQYALIAITSFGAVYFGHRLAIWRHNRQRAEVDNARITLLTRGDPIQVRFEPEFTDETYSLSVTSRTKGLLVAPSISEKARAAGTAPVPPTRKVSGITMTTMIPTPASRLRPGTETRQAYCVANIHVYGSPGSIKVVVTASSGRSSTRIIPIRRPARMPAESHSQANASEAPE